MKYILYTYLFLFLIVLFCACKDNPKTVRLEVLEIFQVEGDESDKRPTVLKYKDVKEYDENGLLLQQNFYEVDNSLKGYEFIKRDGNTGITNYYNSDSILLAIYELEYNGNEISKRVGYDGKTREHLRTESLKYNTYGLLSNKLILDQAGNTSSSYEMKYDSNGNEILFRMLDANGELRMEEKFVITKLNTDKKWTEKWGYIDEAPNSFHRRSFSYKTLK